MKANKLLVLKSHDYSLIPIPSTEGLGTWLSWLLACLLLHYYLMQDTTQEGRLNSEELSSVLHGTSLHSLLWSPLSSWTRSDQDAHQHSVHREAGDGGGDTRFHPVPWDQEWWGASHPVLPPAAASGAQVSGQYQLGSVVPHTPLDLWPQRHYILPC